jgi:hypothetical protein
MVADEAGLEITSAMDTAGTRAVATKQDAGAEKADPASELEARLAALRG